MSVELGPSFPVTFQGIPPHVSAEDLVLWEQFRRRHGAEYKVFYFDVGLGEGEGSPETVSPNVAAAWRRLTKFRADVVGDTGSEWHLIEMRNNAGPGAIGALQTYSTLWLGRPPDARPLRVILVTNQITADARAVAGLSGIEVRVFGGGL